MKTKLTVILAFVVLNSAMAAEIHFPRLEMVTLGRTLNDEFGFSTSVSADLALSGGFKYGLEMGFSFDSLNLAKTLAYKNFKFQHLPNPGDPLITDDYNDLVDRINDRIDNSGIFTFRLLKASLRDLFNLPLEFNFFVGEGDIYCSGDEFSRRFGSEPVGSYYRGLFYFPDGIGGNVSRRYYGIHSAAGTGISMAFTLWDSFVPMIYIYENFPLFMNTTGDFGKSFYSGDLRFLINREKFKMDFFGGLSYKDGVIIRAGLLTHFFTGKGIEFLLQGGITGWDLNEALNIDSFFFLLEPRFRFGIFGFYGTLFFHPVTYNNITTIEEQGKTDINLRFFAEIPNTNFMAGIETGIGLRIKEMEDFTFCVSPFFSFVGSGIQWDTKVRVNLFGNDGLKEMFELFIGVSTSF